MISIENTDDEIKAHYREPNGYLKSWVRTNDKYMGRRADGVVLLRECQKCFQNYVRVEVGPRGPLPKRCHECSPRKVVEIREQVVDCALCGDPFERGTSREGRLAKYCSKECRAAARKAYLRKYSSDLSDDAKRRYAGGGMMLLRKKRGTVPTSEPQRCLHCGVDVDPRQLSEHGWFENGTFTHMAAGTAPESNDPGGPSCTTIVRKQQSELLRKKIQGEF